MLLLLLSHTKTTHCRCDCWEFEGKSSSSSLAHAGACLQHFVRDALPIHSRGCMHGPGKEARDELFGTAGGGTQPEFSAVNLWTVLRPLQCFVKAKHSS